MLTDMAAIARRYGEFIVQNADIRKEEMSQINNLNFCFKKMEKEEETKLIEAEGKTL